MKSSSERMAVLLHSAAGKLLKQPITRPMEMSTGVRVALQTSVWACAGSRGTASDAARTRSSAAARRGRAPLQELGEPPDGPGAAVTAISKS